MSEFCNYYTSVFGDSFGFCEVEFAEEHIRAKRFVFNDFEVDIANPALLLLNTIWWVAYLAVFVAFLFWILAVRITLAVTGTSDVCAMPSPLNLVYVILTICDPDPYIRMQTPPNDLMAYLNSLNATFGPISVNITRGS